MPCTTRLVICGDHHRRSHRDPAATCVVLFRGAVRAGLPDAGGAARRRRCRRPRGLTTASAVIAVTAVPHAARPGAPWMPVAVIGFFGLLLALRRIPVVARALARRA